MHRTPNPCRRLWPPAWGRAIDLLAWALLAAALLAVAGAAGAAIHVVTPSDQPAAFAATLAKAKDGDVIEVVEGEYRGVVGVITQKRLTIRGIGKRPVFVADGKHAEGKAILVVKDGDITIENVEFRGARVPDGNGAGIRFEKGRLTVRRCAFFDNENGLITANFNDAVLEIVDSEFARAPRREGSLPHLLYVGRIAKVTIVGSRFHRGFEGHLIKSRARESVITYNMIRDSGEGEASYEIDLPSGGVATIVGNVIGQSPRTQNPVIVAYGVEGSAWPRNALYLAHNTIINEGWTPGWFLRVFRAQTPEVEEVVAVNNLIVGSGIFWLGASGEFAGNWPATLGMLRDVTTLAFELPPDSWLRGRGVDPRQIGGRDLAPRAEFEWPVGTREIPADRARWSPGAYQR